MAEKRVRRETPTPTTTTTTTTNIIDLHNDLLNLIIERLDQKSLRSISLVSPLFTPLIDTHITELSFNHLISDSRVKRIFNRFSSVSEISLNLPSIGRALIMISNSSLKIEALMIEGNPSYPDKHKILKLQSSPGMLKNVKLLKVRWFCKNIGFRRMVEFIKIFSGIHELELSSGERWNNDGIRLLVTNVPSLRGFKLVESEYLMNETLNFLALSCKDLQHVSLEGSSGVSPEGICAFIRKMPNLQTLRLPVFSKFFTQGGLIQLGNAVRTLQNLTHLAICDYLVIDDVFKAIGKSELRLTSLEVHKVDNRGFYTTKGLGTLLKASRSLTRLEVYLPEFDLDNQDHEMSQIVKFLSQLKQIQINTHNWFHETLFSLIENCRELESIIISGYEGKCGSDIHVTPPQKKNVSIKYIRIGPRLEESLRTILESSCPVLKRLESF